MFLKLFCKGSHKAVIIGEGKCLGHRPKHRKWNTDGQKKKSNCLRNLVQRGKLLKKQWNDRRIKTDYLEKPVWRLCTELHGKSKYCRRNGGYPETYSPPSTSSIEKYHFQIPPWTTKKIGLKTVQIVWKSFIKDVSLINCQCSIKHFLWFLPTNNFLGWESDKKSSHKSKTCSNLREAPKSTPYKSWWHLHILRNHWPVSDKKMIIIEVTWANDKHILSKQNQRHYQCANLCHIKSCNRWAKTHPRPNK